MVGWESPLYTNKEEIIETYEPEEGSKMSDMPLWVLEYIPYLGTKSGNTSLSYISDDMESCHLWMSSSFGQSLGAMDRSCQ